MIKRPHYFKGQFLKADDFIAEQQYHMQMRRSHNSSLHTWGVVDGFNVTANDAGIKITAGSAIDSDGKEIWLTEDKSLPIAQSTANGSYFVVISYKEGYDPGSPYPPASDTEPEDSKYIRKLETGEPGLVAATPAPANEAVLLKLALVSVSSGKVTGQPDISVRRFAASVRTNGSNLEIRPVTKDGALRFMTGTPLTARLTIDAAGKVGIGINDPKETLDVGGDIRLDIHNLYFTDKNHGIGVYGSGNKFNGAAINGPVVYGFGGGALGSNQNWPSGLIQTIALRWTDKGNVGIATADPVAALQVRPAPANVGNARFFNGVAALFSCSTDNGGNSLRDPETVMVLAREGVEGQSYANFARFDLGSYGDKKTQLNIRLSHDPLSSEADQTPVIMSLRSNGNVGIGTIDPKGRLSISEPNGSVAGPDKGTIVIDHENAGGASSIVFRSKRNPASDYGYIQYQDDTTVGGTGESSLLIIGAENDNADHVILKPSGNVGIGITDPKGRLSIFEPTGTVAALNQGTILIDHDNTGGASSIVFRSKNNPGSDYGYIQYQDDTTVGGTGESSLLIIGAENDNADHVILKPSGNVGIGTTDPKAMLQVGKAASEGSPSVRIGWGANNDEDRLTIFSSDAYRMGLRRGGRDLKIFAKSPDNDGHIYLMPNDTVAMSLMSSGNVGIGTLKPQFALAIKNGERLVQIPGSFSTSSEGDPTVYFVSGTTVSGINPGDWIATGDERKQVDKVVSYGIQMKLPSFRGSSGPFYVVRPGPPAFRSAPESTKFTVAGDTLFAGDSSVTGTLRCWGDIIANGSIQGDRRDLAENYLSDMDLAPGDLVCLDPGRDRILRSEKANDTLAIGVISTDPGVLLNGMQEESKEAGTLAYPVALCGRVPCKVTDENGPIKRGDLLTSSSISGHAMRARPVMVGGVEIYRSGTIIGKALEPHKSGKGLIEVFIVSR